jgi:hypothetical protein
LLLPPPAGGEGWEGGRIIKNISLKGQNRNNLNCYMNCEEIHSYRDWQKPLTFFISFFNRVSSLRSGHKPDMIFIASALIHTRTGKNIN